MGPVAAQATAGPGVLPLLVFPDHLVRPHERVAWEFSQNSGVTHVSALVTVPRHKVDAATDGKSFFFQSVDADLVEGWGEGLEVASAVCLLAPVKLQHFPASEAGFGLEKKRVFLLRKKKHIFLRKKNK